MYKMVDILADAVRPNQTSHLPNNLKMMLFGKKSVKIKNVDSKIADNFCLIVERVEHNGDDSNHVVRYFSAPKLSFKKI